MGYLKIQNLYQNQEIMMFKEVFALEKIHGSSGHVAYEIDKPELRFFCGGCSHENFVKLFDDDLYEKFKAMGCAKVIVYGEGAGGKMQGMSGTYGKELFFVAFDVKIDGMWLSVPKAETVVLELGLEFVDFNKVSTDLDEINKQRDLPSKLAVRKGITEPKKREGVVLRPLIEMTKNNGSRMIAKHKGDDFRETKTKREVNPEELKILQDANAISEEWVTENRLSNILSRRSEELDMSQIKDLIKIMIDDIYCEGSEEIVPSKAVSKAIGKETALLIKKRVKSRLEGECS